MILTRQELDKLKCGNPECTAPNCKTLYLHSRCHPEAPLDVKYTEGVLTFNCIECEALVVEIAVAPGPLH